MRPKPGKAFDLHAETVWHYDTLQSPQQGAVSIMLWGGFSLVATEELVRVDKLRENLLEVTKDLWLRQGIILVQQPSSNSKSYSRMV